MSYSHREYLNDEAFTDSEDSYEENPYPESPLAAHTRLSPESDPGSPLPASPTPYPDRYDSIDSRIHIRGELPRSFAASPSPYRRSESPSFDGVSRYDDHNIPYIPPDVAKHPVGPITGICPRMITQDSAEEDDRRRSPSPEPVRHNLRPRHTAAPRRAPPPDSDQESDDSGSEYSDNEPDSDDSVMSLSPHLKRSRVQKHGARRTHSRSSPPPLLSSSSGHRSSLRHHPYLPHQESGSLARTKQVKASELAQPLGFQCPHCHHYQKNHRRPDLRRHISTHFQSVRGRHDGPSWFCCGVPLSLAEEYGVTDTGNAQKWHWTGNLRMVGGCGQQFSRKDAYHRHLRNRNCVGDVHGDWIPGNIARK